MLIFPAIDIRDGKIVRLTEGDYDRMTVYGHDPLAVARAYREAGAECLHVVDLDAALAGAQKNLEMIQKLAKESGLFLPDVEMSETPAQRRLRRQPRRLVRGISRGTKVRLRQSV